MDPHAVLREELIDFDKAELRPGFVNNTYILVVGGQKPTLATKVRLVAPYVYTHQPEYWDYQVLGKLDVISPAVLTPYVASRDVTHKLGTKGVRVTGANGKVVLVNK